MKHERQYSLDFLKVIATLFILFHHYQQYISGCFASGVNYYGGRFNFGYMVELFFVLSGYFMYPYIKKIRDGMTLKEYFAPRYLRLIPLVAVAAFVYQALVLLSIKTVGQAWFMTSPQVWETLVAMLGFQEGWGLAGNIYVNYPVWYVSVLLLCYLAFYGCTVLSKKMRISARYLYIAMVFLGVAVRSRGLNRPFLTPYTGRGYCAFFVGVLLATYCYERHATKKETIFSVVIALVITDLIALHTGFVSVGMDYIALFLLYPAIILICRNALVCRIFSHGIFQTMASVAFNAFVWQMPLIVLVLLLNGWVGLPFDLFARASMWSFAAVAMAVGAVSHFLLEKNINKRIVARGAAFEKRED